MLPDKIAFVDVETTGLKSIRDRIIEIGIIRIENNKVVAKYKTLLNPQCYLPEDIEILTGISHTKLQKAPLFSDVADTIYELLSGCVFAAHNVRFDYGFLKNEFKRINLKFAPKQLCTVKLSKKLYPRLKSHNLDSIISNFKISTRYRHRAYDDALVLWNFYKKLLKIHSAETLEKAIDAVTRKPFVPLGLSSEDLKDIPKGPGVYIFYGQDNMPLYIGKSIKLKERVISHFLGNHSVPLEVKISAQIKRISTIQTNGELGALLTEASLIKKLSPLYNRKLRHASALICAKKKLNEQGYYKVELEQASQIESKMLGDIVGIFKSKKQAKDFLFKLSEQYTLCTRLLGIEHTLKECFEYRLGKCKGACSGLEKPLYYNFRFENAFLETKIRSWPFNGPILVKERYKDKVSSYFINNWCFLGEVENEEIASYSNLSSNLPFKNNGILFDLDTYKIINSYIRKKENMKNITILSSEKN